MASANHRIGDKNKSFTVASYNCHGWNQASAFLSRMCDSNDLNCDCIFLQELWLTPANLYKVETFSDNYTFYGKSAMEKAVSISILKGRPFGGVGILLKNNLCKMVLFVKCLERISIVALNDTLFISVYLPSGRSQFEIDIISKKLAEIEGTISIFPNHKLVWCGAFNLDLSSSCHTS